MSVVVYVIILEACFTSSSPLNIGPFFGPWPSPAAEKVRTFPASPLPAKVKIVQVSMGVMSLLSLSLSESCPVSST